MSDRILLIEDDEQIRNLITEYFTDKSNYNYEIIPISTGEEGSQWSERGDYNLVLLDVMLPGVDGFTLCKKFRKNSSVPIIFITAKTRERDRLYGYEIGCDDYVCKPFSFAELYAKVTVLLKRCGAPVEKYLKCGRICLNTCTLVVTVDGNEVELPPKEFEILCFLIEHKGWVFSRDQLLDHIWGDSSFTDPRVVDNRIKNLRKALGPAGQQIKTVISKGYKLTED